MVLDPAPVRGLGDSCSEVPVAGPPQMSDLEWGGEVRAIVCKASSSSPETQTNLGASAGLCEFCALVDYILCGSAAISGKALRAAGSLPTLAAGVEGCLEPRGTKLNPRTRY